MQTSQKNKPMRYAPGINVEIRDEAWRVLRVDPIGQVHDALTVIGLSELVRDHEAIFSTEHDKVRVLDPRETKFIEDTSSQYLTTRLYMESMARKRPPVDERLHVGHLAAMDPLDFQLEPAELALSRPRHRILIADAVGLGKTLEAGILLSELIARGKGKRILVVALKSLLTQFQKEMWARFTIPLVRLDSIGLQRVSSEIPTNHNPFHFFDRSIISIDTLKQPRYRNYLETARWDVIVIDEAHNVAARGSGSGSARHRVAELLASRSDSLIMLSATPHDGKAESFASLMNMLDPTAIADNRNYTQDDIKRLYLRRFKKDVAEQLAEAVPERKISQVYAEASQAEEEAFDLFSNLSFARLDRNRGAGQLFKTSLEKSLLSSPAACIDTIENRVRRLKRRDDASDFAGDIDQLEELREALEAITPEDFAKYQEFLRVLSEQMKWKPGKSKDRLVIFSERIPTMRWLYKRLREDLDLEEDQIAELHGGMSDVDQQHIVEEFGKQKSKLCVLVASDVASEGINLHYLCHRMVHFDIPWSLMVFQQRNGRIDRYGQTKRPQIVYMLTESVNEDFEADRHILDILIRKDQQVQENIGDPAAITGRYSQEDEEDLVASVIESKQSAEDFDAMLTGNADDFFAKLMGGLDGEPEEEVGHGFSSVETAPPAASLFASDYDYLCCALTQMTEEQPPVVASFEADDKKQKVSLLVPPDLARRFKKLPRELQDAAKKKDRVVLTSDAEVMQQAVIDARREESAWPGMQYLWRQHPIFEWVEDRMLGKFRRNQAPVMELSQGLEDGEVAILLSGLIPNLKSQPVLHHWFVARFPGGKKQDATLQSFEEFLRQTRLTDSPPPNSGTPGSFARLDAVLPDAVERMTLRMRELRDAFERDNRPKLDEELRALQTLQRAQLDAQQDLFAKNARKLDDATRKISHRFEEHKTWVKETMKTEDVPFIQVIAGFVGK